MKMTTIIIMAAVLTAGPASAQIVDHPHGCPRTLFCGCGVSVRAFGRPIRELFLVANWNRKFPRRSRPAPGYVATHGRRGGGHIVYIEAVNSDGTARVYDPNSGGHATRVHDMSLRGWKILDPNG